MRQRSRQYQPRQQVLNSLSTLILLHLGDKSAGYVHEQQTTILSTTCSQVLRYSLDGKDVPTPLAQANAFAAVPCSPC